MSKIQILMPMGGLGSRFTKAGYKIPKPLIMVDGMHMFEKALQSFRDLQDVQYIFVIRKDHEEIFDVSNSILERYPDARIVVMEHDTRGAVETCMLAKGYIEDTSPVIIADCDTYFESKEYFKIIANTDASAGPEGLLLTFSSDDQRYSYAELDGANRVVRTAEKIVISNRAILGGYYFKTGHLFINLATNFIKQDLSKIGLKEYYLSHLFNIMISNGLNVEVADVDKMHIFGTPEELNIYLNEHSQEVI